jgi:hypothetical protein
MMIVTRPEHDLTTKYISFWAEEIISLAKKKGMDVIDLKKNKANKLELAGRIKKLNPRALFLNGHGDKECVTGHNNEILINDSNHELLKGKIIYALSCQSGSALGKKALEFENTVYIGYKDDFAFITDKDYHFKPLDDPSTGLFMEASNQVMISLLKGNSAGQASQKSIQKFLSNSSKLLTSNTDVNSLYTAQCLWWNARNQVCLGSGEAIM